MAVLGLKQACFSDAPAVAGRDRRPAPPRPIWRRAEHGGRCGRRRRSARPDRKSTRLNSSHQIISYPVFCLKKKKKTAFDCTLWISGKPTQRLPTERI